MKVPKKTKQNKGINKSQTKASGCSFAWSCWCCLPPLPPVSASPLVGTAPANPAFFPFLNTSRVGSLSRPWHLLILLPVSPRLRPLHSVLSSQGHVRPFLLHCICKTFLSVHLLVAHLSSVNVSSWSPRTLSLSPAWTQQLEHFQVHNGCLLSVAM